MSEKVLTFSCSNEDFCNMFNTYGNIFRLTTFGESHGAGIGGVVDGMPAGIEIDMDFIQQELSRRMPGQSALTTSRKEPDEVELLSGVFENKSTGTPIGFLVRNTNQHSQDYDNLRDVFRPSHAVFKGYTDYDFSQIEQNAVRCPDSDKAAEMETLIKEVKAAGDTIGGAIRCVIQGCPIGLGEPVFGKLHAALAGAMMGINAAKGFEYGEGFGGMNMRGSEQNDVFYNKNGIIETRTNHSGGIQGGISNGQDICFRVAFKPVATLLFEQSTVDIAGNEAIVKAKGRHDPCVLPRAVPIVEAMAAMTILDYYLLNKTTKL